MDVSKPQKNEGDMMKSGQFCPKCDDEMEAVTGTYMYVCHTCGRQETREIRNGKTIRSSIQFEGF